MVEDVKSFAFVLKKHAILSQDVKIKNLVNDFHCLQNISFNATKSLELELYIVGNETTMESSETTNREMGEKTKFSIRDLFKYVLIGLSSLLGLVLIMYIWLLLYQKKKNERQYIY